MVDGAAGAPPTSPCPDVQNVATPTDVASSLVTDAAAPVVHPSGPPSNQSFCGRAGVPFSAQLLSIDDVVHAKSRYIGKVIRIVGWVKYESENVRIYEIGNADPLKSSFMGLSANDIAVDAVLRSCQTQVVLVEGTLGYVPNSDDVRNFGVSGLVMSVTSVRGAWGPGP